jgi:hypothetical protein
MATGIVDYHARKGATDIVLAAPAEFQREETATMLRIATRFGQLRLLAGMCRHLRPM